MSRPTDRLRAEIAQRFREMPDDLLLAVVSAQILPKRGRRPKAEPDVGRELAGLRVAVETALNLLDIPLAEMTARATDAEAQWKRREAAAEEGVALAREFLERAEAAEAALDVARAEVISTQQARDKGYAALANAQMVHSLDQQAIDAVNDRVERGEAAEKALADREATLDEVRREVDRLKENLLDEATGAEAEASRFRVALDEQRALVLGTGPSLMPFARAWKACAREMRSRWLFALRRSATHTKPVSSLVVPTPFEAREKERISSGYYERDRPTPEEPEDDLDEDPPPPPKDNAPRLNTGGPLRGDGRRSKR